MKKNCFKLLCIAILIVLLIGSLVACGTVNASVSVGETLATTDDDSQSSGDIPKNTAVSTAKFNEGVVLVKTESFDKTMLGTLQYKSVDVLYKNSLWHKVVLEENASTQDAVAYLRDLNTFDKVDYDYIMGSDGEVESIDISSNPNSSQQTYLDTHKIKDAWGYLKDNDKTPGGSPDVVVAVIDTGVDYNHVDLRNNIWVNTGEIPGNGIDDDGNGYIDDYYGWNCVGDNNDPMDDNGHGTHVAGIIAAENNSFGTVGVAYNCKVMCIKAGNSSGYFNNSDIAEAIQYAYMNGASVINMSFGGKDISFAVEDALKEAYNSTILVAAAGNNSISNEPLEGVPFYPAALTYVIGVMSCDNAGVSKSDFSNSDPIPFNNYEYEIYATGEQILSTWPNNKIAMASGTSMSAPIISSAAAILRSYYTDREMYSTKFIQSQLINTGKTISGHGVLDLNAALSTYPKPKISLYNYYIFDNKEFSEKNNGDGIVDAGETIRLGIELFNRGGVADNVSASIDMIRNGDASIVDPYFNITKQVISLENIGTYSVRDGGKVYDEEDNVISMIKVFEFIVSDDCPHSYISNINIHITYKNGLDTGDLETYNYDDTISLHISNGIKLPSVVSEDTVFVSGKRYIVSSDMIISPSINVVFEAGSDIQFFEESNAYKNTLYNSPKIVNYGNLIFQGTAENRIKIHPSDSFHNFRCIIENSGTCKMFYCDYSNGKVSGFEAYNCYLYDETTRLYDYEKGSSGGIAGGTVYGGTIDTSIIDLFSRTSRTYGVITNSKIHVGDSGQAGGIYKNNVVLLETCVSGSAISVNDNGENNVFLTTKRENKAANVPMIKTGKNLINNSFFGSYQDFGDLVVTDVRDTYGNVLIDLNYEAENYDQLFPFVRDISIFNVNGDKIKTVGNEEFVVRVVFSSQMDRTVQPMIGFGTQNPYSDYLIRGEYVNNYTWQGKYQLKAYIENGEQLFNVQNAVSIDGKELANNSSCFGFSIDTTSALSMSMQANAVENGIALEWEQDDYDTLMGYNVYRSEEKDGNFVKLNRAAIPAGENTFVDENAEPGKTYWYTFTVVLSDMSESKPAGKISCTATDTIAPSIYHTPVNQGYKDNNLVISCTASDNISIAYVKLYYRQCGTTTWKVLTMSKMNDKYSATIFGNEMTLDGVEYYIVASDGRNEISRGTADTPYTIVVKDASEISRIGDVDGDGRITTKDALMIMQSINGDLLLSDDQFKRADLNGDGVLSSVEALRILQYINGNVSTLEMK